MIKTLFCNWKLSNIETINGWRNLICYSGIAVLLSIFLTGCAIIENSLFYSNFSFVYETSYPKGTMTVNSPRIYHSREQAKADIFKAAENYCEARG
jgi:uncharacterized protein YcfL